MVASNTQGLVDGVLAGDQIGYFAGRFGGELRRRAEGLDNVIFEDRLDAAVSDVVGSSSASRRQSNASARATWIS